MENNNNNNNKVVATNGQQHLGSNGLNIKNEALEHTMEAQVRISRSSNYMFVLKSDVFRLTCRLHCTTVTVV